jgi:hypothetical protein
MKRILALAILAAALFSGCSPTLHPAITAQVSGGTLTVSGTGFSQTTPCASLSIFYNPGTPLETFASINKQMSCNSGNTSFTNYTWSIPPQTCPSGNTTGTIPATVLAIDIPTFDPATAQVSIPCSQPMAVLCPPSLQGNQLPTANWSPSSTAPGYYASQSAILNGGNGNPITPQPSLSAIESAMGGVAKFKAATFSVPPGTNGYGTDSELPTGVILCGYDSPQFTYRNQQAVAQVEIACTTSCASL